ncbi:expressed protein [Phakopsora pachyrhizi]|uniref:Expressed protein n=1 Tax=Phakopsora pachyrhizi TaxID=170000 RepID=A0AAV0AJA3_PHAPC|nr:expressed protein [Phakopsora pachyrhizi]
MFKQPPWGAIRWYPSYFAFHIQAWTAWFTRKTFSNDISRREIKRWAHPLVFNGILIGSPVIVAIAAIIMSFQHQEASQKYHLTSEVIFQTLANASKEWDEGRKLLTKNQTRTLENQYLNYRTQLNLAQKHERSFGLWGSLGAVPIVVFYIASVMPLLREIRNRVNAVKKISKNDFKTSKKIEKFDTVDSSSSLVDFSKFKSSKLNQSYAFLASHYALMALTLSFNTGVGLWNFIQSESGVSKKKTLFLFLVLELSGCWFLVLAMIALLSRMILVEISERRSDSINKTDDLQSKSDNFLKPKIFELPVTFRNNW